MSELSKEFKKKLEDLAKDNDETTTDVAVLFVALKSKILELEPHLPDMKANIRTYNGLTGYYNNKRFNRGTEFIIVPMGIQSEPKDTNKILRDEIYKDFSNPQKRLKMIAGNAGDGSDGKVMVMKTSDKVVDGKTVFFTDVYKPVKIIRKMTQLSNSEWVVVDGDLWQPGDKPIPRNYKKTVQYVKDGEVYTNKGWSRSLNPNWKFSIFGLGYFSGIKQVKVGEEFKRVPKNTVNDGLISRITFYGAYADPNSPKFIGKKALWFMPCKLKVVDSKYSSELFLQATAKTDIEISSKKIKIPEIIGKVNKRIEGKAKKLISIVSRTDFDELPKDKAKKLHDLEALYKKFTMVDYIPIIDLAGVNQYHFTHRAKRGKASGTVTTLETTAIPAIGNPNRSVPVSEEKEKNFTIEKDEKGVWDNIDFNSFAISECAFTGVYAKEGKPPKMILSDYSLPENQSLFCKFSNGLNSDLPPSSVYVSLTTSRGNQAYDPDTKKFVVDPENAVAMPKIKGICVLLDYSKIDIEGLIGDL